MIPTLTFEEARVFGALIEKSQATPAYYPMSLNALRNACNQITGRDPVTNFDEDTVETALEGLRTKGLVAYASGVGRVLKYMHRAGRNGLELTPAEAAVVSVLLLRGPQTAGEIRVRTASQFRFENPALVEETIKGLMAETRGIVEEAPRKAGQKETRYRHRFFVYPPGNADHAETGHPTARGSSEADHRDLRSIVAELQKENAVLRARVDELERIVAELASRLQAG
ncbi:MAG: DUF480 domain-containing protein [Bacteroidota bacterium]|nr:DUF480 domain-containing protein [Bacteroidota bacterium]